MVSSMNDNFSNHPMGCARCIHRAERFVRVRTGVSAYWLQKDQSLGGRQEIYRYDSLSEKP